MTATVGTVVNHARALRLLPLATIIGNGGGVLTGAAPDVHFRKTGDDAWTCCDPTGVPYDVQAEWVGPFRSEAIHLPARVVALPPKTPPIAGSLLAVVLTRHAVVGIVEHTITAGERDVIVLKCRCGMECHDHPAHQFEEIITAAINDARLDPPLPTGGTRGR